MLLKGPDLGLAFEHFEVALDTGTGIARVVISRPEKLNALLMSMRAEFAEIFRTLERDGRARAVVLRGAGERAFSAGGDVAGFLEADAETLSYLHENIAAPERFAGAVIAAIDGYCFGVGLEIALACDFRVATTRAVFAQPELKLGMIPGSGATQRLVRYIGLGRAKEMVLRGRWVEAMEALEWGLVTRVVEPAELDEAAEALAQELARMPAGAFKAAKRVLNLAQDMPLSAGLQLEGFAYGMLRGTPDFVEGVRAFLDKREPRFRNQPGISGLEGGGERT
jgi:2-oxoglutaroyl-CoA hydrolase